MTTLDPIFTLSPIKVFFFKITLCPILTFLPITTDFSQIKFFPNEIFLNFFFILLI